MIKKNRGISLLEMLLVLAIGAAIIMMAVRYFSVTRRDLTVTHAIRQIQTLTKASYEWLQAQKQANFSNNNGGEKIDLKDLITAELIENTDRDTKDPWNKTIIIAPGNNPNNVKITLPNVPKKSCKNLARRLNGVNKTDMPKCDSDRNDYSGEF